MNKNKLPIEGKLPTRWEIYYYTLMGNFNYWLRMLVRNQTVKTGDFQEADVGIINEIQGGDVSKNIEIIKYLSENPLNSAIIETSKIGAPIIKLGDGSMPRVMITAGVHGNELPPQIAAINLINDLNETSVNGTVYIIPFSAPKASAQNSKLYNGENLNLVADTQGTPTNTILNMALELQIDALADFHATSTHPKKDAVIYFLNIQSSKMAVYINKKSNSELMALIYNPGTLIAAANNKNIPTILCEVKSSDGVASNEAIEVSHNQMKEFLNYHGII